MTRFECHGEDSFLFLEEANIYELLPLEFDIFQLQIPAFPYGAFHKWFAYADDEDEERYDEDW